MFTPRLKLKELLIFYACIANFFSGQNTCCANKRFLPPTPPLHFWIYLFLKLVYLICLTRNRQNQGRGLWLNYTSRSKVGMIYWFQIFPFYCGICIKQAQSCRQLTCQTELLTLQKQSIIGWQIQGSLRSMQSREELCQPAPSHAGRSLFPSTALRYRSWF